MPKHFVSSDADRLGLKSDLNFDAIVSEYLRGLGPQMPTAEVIRSHSRSHQAEVGPTSASLARILRNRSGKTLKAHGLEFDCFEKGLRHRWECAYENDSGFRPLKELHIDTSRKNLGYSDFSIPDDKPEFLSHSDFLAHLEAYADRSGFARL